MYLDYKAFGLMYGWCSFCQLTYTYLEICGLNMCLFRDVWFDAGVEQPCSASTNELLFARPPFASLSPRLSLSFSFSHNVFFQCIIQPLWEHRFPFGDEISCSIFTYSATRLLYLEHSHQRTFQVCLTDTCECVYADVHFFFFKSASVCVCMCDCMCDITGNKSDLQHP